MCHSSCCCSIGITYSRPQLRAFIPLLFRLRFPMGNWWRTHVIKWKRIAGRYAHAKQPVQAQVDPLYNLTILYEILLSTVCVV
jgi:hypothetical protein